VLQVLLFQKLKKKIQSHNDVLNKYNEQESKKSNLEKLHKEVTELGDNSGKFSSLSFNDISEKHNKVGVELNKRTEELEKEKELQLSHVKMISEWNEKAKEFSTHTTQQKELLEKEESGTLLSQLRSLKEKHSLIQENQKNLEELKKQFDNLVNTEISNRVETPYQNLEISHTELNEIFSKRTKDFEERILQLFKLGVTKYIQWNQTKQATELAEDVTKIPTITAVQNKMKSMEILSKDLDNQKNVFSETQKVGEEIISDQLSFKDEVQQLLNNCTETTSTTEKLIQENNEKLQKHLALKQSIEEKCLKFAALVQNFNTLLDNEKKFFSCSNFK